MPTLKFPPTFFLLENTVRYRLTVRRANRNNGVSFRNAISRAIAKVNVDLVALWTRDAVICPLRH